MTFAQQLDERIVIYERERAILEARFQGCQKTMNEIQIRSVQIQGAINELNDLKTKLNGSTPQ